MNCPNCESVCDWRVADGMFARWECGTVIVNGKKNRSSNCRLLALTTLLPRLMEEVERMGGDMELVQEVRREME